MLWRAGHHAGVRAPRQRRLALHQHAHRAGLFADACGPAHGPQLAQREHGRRGRDGHGVSRHELRASPVRRTAGRNTAAQRLRYRHVRQIPRAAAVGIECLRAAGPLAGALWLRQVLRVSSGRVRPLLPGPLRWRDPHPDATRIRITTSAPTSPTRPSSGSARQQSLTPDKPFFIYYAAAGTHDPHHVPKEWIDKYKGKFDQGWDKLREETLARQIKLGTVPPDTKLAPMPEMARPWSSFTPEEQRVLAREMEVYAAHGRAHRLRDRSIDSGD